MVDTILIDGHNVRALTGCRVVGLIDGIYAPGTRRGDPADGVVGGADGALGSQRPLDYYIITIPLWVEGATSGARNANLRALGPLLTGTNGLVTISRVIDTATTPDTHTAPGQFITGLSPQQMNSRTGRINLQYYQLAGFWLGGSTKYVP